MAKYLKIQSIILCVCMLVSALSGLSVIAADPLELVSWDADADFITLDFNQAIDLENSAIAIMHGETYLAEDEFTLAKADANANVQADGVSSRYTYKVTLDDGIVLEDEYTISFEDVAAAEGSSTLEHRDLTFAVYELADDEDLVDIVPYKWGNSNTWVRDEETGGMMVEEWAAGNNMSYWSVVGARVGNDTTEEHILPNKSLPAGSANWTETDYTVKATIKSSNTTRFTVNFGIASDTQNMHSETATGAKFTGIKTYDYAAMSTTDHEAAYYLMKNSNYRTNAASRAVYFDRTKAPNLNPEAGFEFKVSSKDGVVRAFLDGGKLMDGEVEVLPGYPFLSMNPSGVTANTKAKVQIYDFQVTQCREISGAELDKTENVEVKDTLEVTFENAIDPATKDDIKIIPEGGDAINSENYTVSLSDGDTVATITFVERLEYETNYTIDFADVKVAANDKIFITNLAFRTKDLPPQSPELISSWDADTAGVEVTFSEPISEYEATLSKNGVEIESTAGAVAGPEVIVIAPADGSAIEEGIPYEIKLENIANVGDTKALLIWKKAFVLGEVEGAPYAYQIVDAELDSATGLDIEGSLDITFDTEIDEATIGGIVLNDENGDPVNTEDYTVSLSADKLTATIEYAKLVYESDYEIVFTDVKVAAEDRLAAINPVAFATKVEPIALDEVFVDWNADLDFITLEFNAEITDLDATLKQGNSTVPVTFEAAASEYMDAGNSTRYTYKVIPEGGLQPFIGYALTIYNVDCETEIWADDEKTINFKVDLLDEGFVGPTTASGKDTYVYKSNGTVTQHEDGLGLKIQYSGQNKARTMITHGVGEDSDASKAIGSVLAQPNSVYSHKDYTLKATFKNITGTSTSNIGIGHTFAPNANYGFDHTWYRGIGIQMAVASSSLRAYSHPIPTDLGDTDGDGSTNYAYNTTTMTDTSYSGLNGTTGIELKLAMKDGNANFFVNGDKMLNIIDHGNNGAALLMFEPTSSTASDSYAEIVDIVMTRAYEICAAEIDADVDVDLTGEVTVTLEEEILSSEVAKIKLLDSDGNEVEGYSIEAASANEIVVTFEDLAYKSVYTLNFDDVTLESGKELANIPFMTIYPPTEIESFGVVGGGEIEGTVTISAVIKNNTDSAPCVFTATVAIYNSKGQMVAVQGGAYTLTTGQSCTVSVADFVCDSEETYTAKCFVWDSLEDMTEKEFSLAVDTVIGE